MLYFLLMFIDLTNPNMYYIRVLLLLNPAYLFHYTSSSQVIVNIDIDSSIESIFS